MSKKDVFPDERDEELIREILKEDETQEPYPDGESVGKERKENKMGILPVKRLIVSMSLPMMVSMLVYIWGATSQIRPVRTMSREIIARKTAKPRDSFGTSLSAFLLFVFLHKNNL